MQTSTAMNDNIWTNPNHPHWKKLIGAYEESQKTLRDKYTELRKAFKQHTDMLPASSPLFKLTTTALIDNNEMPHAAVQIVRDAVLADPKMLDAMVLDFIKLMAEKAGGSPRHGPPQSNARCIS